MNVAEMHVMFRELAQQMGMQEVRAVLDEDIDTCLNIAVNDIIKRIIGENIGSTSKESLLLNNAKIGNINSLRTLYTEIVLNEIGRNCDKNCYITMLDSSNLLLITGLHINYEDIIGFYDVRIIENEFINRTIYDFCNRPTYDSPIATIFGEDDEIFISIYNSSKELGKPIKSVHIIAIRKPATIIYSDNEEEQVNCDLPEYLHIDIVKAATKLWLQSVGITSN